MSFNIKVLVLLDCPKCEILMAQHGLLCNYWREVISQRNNIYTISDAIPILINIHVCDNKALYSTKLFQMKHYNKL